MEARELVESLAVARQEDSQLVREESQAAARVEILVAGGADSQVAAYHAAQVLDKPLVVSFLDARLAGFQAF